MLFSQKSLVCVERAIRISFIILGKSEIAQIPSDVFVGMNILLDRVNIEESVNAYVVNASIISCLFETLGINIRQISSSYSES